MGLKIADLLRWRGSITLKDENDKPILDKGKPVVVYLRVIGDDDLQDSYKVARVISSEKRKKLRDHDSLEFKDQVEPIREATKEECIELIKTAREQDMGSQAYTNVERPDAVKLEEIAVDPDAPTLEEQEKLDAENDAQDAKFQAEIQEYITTRKVELVTELNEIDLPKLREMAELEVSNITSLGLFLQAVLDYKMVYACYNDRLYTERSFESVEEFRATHPVIKDQIYAEYAKIERGTDEIKN